MDVICLGEVFASCPGRGRNGPLSLPWGAGRKRGGRCTRQAAGRAWTGRAWQRDRPASSLTAEMLLRKSSRDSPHLPGTPARVPPLSESDAQGTAAGRREHWPGFSFCFALQSFWAYFPLWKGGEGKKKPKSPFCSPTEMFLDQTREDESGKQKAYCPVLALRSLNTHMVVSCSWGDWQGHGYMSSWADNKGII